MGPQTGFGGAAGFAMACTLVPFATTEHCALADQLGLHRLAAVMGSAHSGLGCGPGMDHGCPDQQRDGTDPVFWGGRCPQPLAACARLGGGQRQFAPTQSARHLAGHRHAGGTVVASPWAQNPSRTVDACPAGYRQCRHHIAHRLAAHAAGLRPGHVLGLAQPPAGAQTVCRHGFWRMHGLSAGQLGTASGLEPPFRTKCD